MLPLPIQGLPFPVKVYNSSQLSIIAYQILIFNEADRSKILRHFACFRLEIRFCHVQVDLHSRSLSFPLRKFHSTWQPVRWMSASNLYHISSLALKSLDPVLKSQL